jgi:methionyl-tRNA synthetase
MKMGKSLGNTLQPNDLVSKFGTDAVRYFFLREVEFGNDGDYSEERFINIVNAHLANTIGTLSLAFIACNIRQQHIAFTFEFLL